MKVELTVEVKILKHTVVDLLSILSRENIRLN